MEKEKLWCLVSVKNFVKDWVVYFLSLKESPLGASLILRSFSQRVEWVTLKEIATQQASSYVPLLSSFFNTETWLVLNSQKSVSLFLLNAGMKYMCRHVWHSIFSCIYLMYFNHAFSLLHFLVPYTPTWVSVLILTSSLSIRLSYLFVYFGDPLSFTRIAYISTGKGFLLWEQQQFSCGYPTSDVYTPSGWGGSPWAPLLPW